MKDNEQLDLASALRQVPRRRSAASASASEVARSQLRRTQIASAVRCSSAARPSWCKTFGAAQLLPSSPTASFLVGCAAESAQDATEGSSEAISAARLAGKIVTSGDALRLVAPREGGRAAGRSEEHHRLPADRRPQVHHRRDAAQTVSIRWRSSPRDALEARHGDGWVYADFLPSEEGGPGRQHGPGQPRHRPWNNPEVDEGRFRRRRLLADEGRPCRWRPPSRNFAASDNYAVVGSTPTRTRIGMTV